ncbi:MAG: trypsin-like peptidase domain-containing protein [Polyangiaceae bacterium]|nr:trypsin-like peptidase domain-containing protein [Polyangiaceae bacterium]
MGKRVFRPGGSFTHLAVLLTVACSNPTSHAEGSRQASEKIVYGTDDRKEFYEVEDRGLQLTAQAAVAFVLNSSVRPGTDPPFVSPTYGEASQLCAGVAFEAQPSAAFCSGVLVDFDLVLTAGHCLRLFPLSQIRIVSHYYYTAPGTLEIQASNVFRVKKIVAEALDPEGGIPRLDFAWVRLDHPVPHSTPVPIFKQPPPLTAGTPLVAVSAPGGIPFKIDAGGQVQDPRSQLLDYFVADTDTAHGASGAGAFSAGGGLVGILARGGEDFVSTPAGCNATNVQPSGGPAGEQFTYAHRAVDGLCQSDPSASSLCRADCAEPCAALPAQPSTHTDHCAVSSLGSPSPRRGWVELFVVAAGFAARRRGSGSRLPWRQPAACIEA